MNKYIFFIIIPALMLIMTSFSGCNNHNPEIKETVCDVENPLTDLEWLSQMVSKFETDTIRSIRVYQCTYQTDKTGFLVEPCIGCPDIGTNLYDCKGNILCVLFGYTGNPCTEFNIDFASEKLIYSLN